MLIVNNLRFGYQHRSILDGLSFHCKAAEVVHLAGPNGVGKSTLMGILAGLLAEKDGEVRFEGPEGPTTDYRQHCEYLGAEANGLYAKLDAMTNLRLWTALRGRKPDDARLIAELSRWGLGSPLVYQDFAVEKFSTGMKRRLALARVSLSQTRLWLLDEPFYGLDRNGIKVFQQALAEHLEQRGAVVIVSHDSEPLLPFKVRVIDLGHAIKH